MKKFLFFFAAMFGLLFGADGMTSADLMNKAMYLGFDGDYTGQNDPLLSFDGNGNWFAGQIKSFTLTINNNTDADTIVYLFKGYKTRNSSITDYALATETASKTEDISCTTSETKISFTALQFDMLAQAVLNLLKLRKTVTSESDISVADGIVFTDANGKTISCSGAPSQIADLMTYLNLHPTWLNLMKLRSTNSAQFQQAIQLTEVNPFSTKESRTIPLTQFTTNKDFQDNLIDIPVGMTIGDIVNMNIKVKANSSLDITYFFGASLDTSKYVDHSAAKANETAVLQVGNPEFVQKVANLGTAKNMLK